MAYPQLPHWAAPFAFGADGVVNAVEQDTIDEIATCVVNVVVCPIGFRSDLPAFGIPDPTFAAAPLNTAPLRAALEQWEPRAQTTLTEHADALNAAVRTITTQVGVRDQ